ncbi:MAG: hypothetical protein ACRDYV_02835 [Acidimicrobiia bacterium]
MGRGRVAPFVLTVLLAVVGVGCGLAGGGQPFGQDNADSVLSYLLVDYSIGGDPVAKGPKVLFKVANAGSQNHRLEVLDDQGESVGQTPAIPLGATVPPLALELEAGTYTLQCTLKNQDGKVHRDLGMTTKLVVQ